MKQLGVRLLILLGLVMISMSSQGKELHTPQANQEMEVKTIERTRRKDSLTCIKEELKAHPEDPVAWVKLTLFYSNPNYELEDINELYQAIMKSVIFMHKHPKRGNEAYAMWRAAYLPAKKRTKKLKALDKAIQKDPNNLDLYEQRANLYLSMGQEKLAQVDFLQMVCVAPNDYRGYEALRDLDNDNLSPVWVNILTLAPTSPIAYLRASEVYFSSDEAIDIAMEGLSRYGDDEFGSLYSRLGYLFNRADAGDERWVSKLQEEIRKHPKDITWTLLLETLYTGPCETYPEQAIRCLQDALKKVPQQDTSSYLSLIGRMPSNYVELGDLDSALMYLNKSIEIDPSFARNHYFKAMILHAFGDTRAAIAELNNYFAHPNSDKDDTETYYTRAYYKYEIKDLSGALADIERAMAKDTVPDPSAYLLRGDIYAAQGKSEQAKADYKIVLENTLSDNPRTRVFALANLGEKEQAMKILTDQVNDYKEFDDLDDSNFYLLLRTLIEQGNVELARYFRWISTEWGYPYPCVSENTRVVKNNPRYKELQKRGINIL